MIGQWNNRLVIDVGYIISNRRYFFGVINIGREGKGREEEQVNSVRFS